MYAVIETGGKQYRVAPGEAITVERLQAQVGDSLLLERVLLISAEEGVLTDPAELQAARVRATVLEHELAPKVTIFKFKSKKRYQRKAGHRQPRTRLRIEEILPSGAAQRPVRKRATRPQRAARAASAPRKQPDREGALEPEQAAGAEQPRRPEKARKGARSEEGASPEPASKAAPARRTGDSAQAERSGKGEKSGARRRPRAGKEE